MSIIEMRAPKRRKAAAAFAVVAIGLAAAGCSKSDANDYGVTPADLEKDFTSKHLGPDWVLARNDQFHLTAEQKTKLAALDKTLAGTVNDAKAKADTAYKAFRMDAGDPSSDRSQVTKDVEALAEAQLGLTKLVIAAHFETGRRSRSRPAQDLPRSRRLLRTAAVAIMNL